MSNNLSFEDYLEKEIKKDPQLRTRLDRISSAMDIAYQVFELRKKHGLTQAGFAKIIGISQPNIARIESADYRNYTIKTLEKVAEALSTTVKVSFVPIETVTGSWMIIPMAGQRNIVHFRSSFFSNPSHATVKEEFAFYQL